MYKNYLTIALRNIIRNRLYSIINIGGLAVGLSACLLIMLFVRDELSYDKWIPGIENIYTIETAFHAPGRPPKEFMVSAVTAGPALKEKIPEVVDSTRLLRNGGTFTFGDKIFRETIREVDANFFDFFDLPMTSGSRAAGLANNLSMLISEDMAKKYFGDEDPLGKIITMDNERSYAVKGVFKNIPENTHFDMGIMVLLDLDRYAKGPYMIDPWDNAQVHTYIKLHEGVTQVQVDRQLPNFIDNNAYFNDWDSSRKFSEMLKLNLMAVTDIHLYASKTGKLKVGGDIMAVYTFSAIAGLILLIASINFMNLATAQSMKRAREVSLRKVMGSSRTQIVIQFLGESIMVTFLGLIFALAITELTLPFYNNIIDKDLSLNFFSNPADALSVFGFTLIIGLLSGVYPALFLSNFRPSKVLRSNKSSFEGGGNLRNMLVIFQFSISIALIVATSVVYAQTYFAKNMDKGFTVDSIYNIFAFDHRVGAVLQTLKLELKALQGVNDVAFSTDSLPKRSNYTIPATMAGQSDATELSVEYTLVGANLLNLYQFQPLAGRLFDENMRGDLPHGPDDKSVPYDHNIVVNQSFINLMGIATPNDAIGRVVKTGKVGYERASNATIIGVVKDTHSRSIRRTISPMMYWSVPVMQRAVISLDLNPSQITATLPKIENIWKTHLPEVVFTGSFVDDNFKALYKAEEQRSQMFTAFSIFAIFISSLGLYALASFAAERRTKEIGLRKVLGADVMDIIRLLIWQFSKPVLWANTLAWPVTWYFMNEWLNGFEYRISMGPMPFVIAGLVALAIAWGTVAHRANKVARTNPIVALRYE